MTKQFLLKCLGYDYDEAEQLITAPPDTALRSFGYCKLYDILGNASGLMRFRTIRLKFPYAGRDWMLQLWKGRFFRARGGDLGLYHKPASRRLAFYDCAGPADYLPMSLRVTRGIYVLADRPATLHWLMTGFRAASRPYKPAQLTLESAITLKDADMLSAVRTALDGCADELIYTVEGLVVRVVW